MIGRVSSLNGNARVGRCRDQDKCQDHAQLPESRQQRMTRSSSSSSLAPCTEIQDRDAIYSMSSCVGHYYCRFGRQSIHPTRSFSIAENAKYIQPENHPPRQMHVSRKNDSVAVAYLVTSRSMQGHDIPQRVLHSVSTGGVQAKLLCS